MRRKLYLGLFLLAVVSIVAADLAFSRLSDAQEPEKKTEAKKESLFDILKKDLGAKKEAPPALPLDLPPPTLPSKPEAKPVLTPQAVDAPRPNQTLPPPTVEPGKDTQKLDFPPLQITKPAAQPSKPPVVSTREPMPTPVVDDKLTLPAQVTKPSSQPAVDVEKLTPAQVAPSNGKAVDPTVIDGLKEFRGEVVKASKSSPWTFHVEMIDGETVLTAIVNKKHEFKIVCQSLDLQTGKHSLSAIGKVKISGDSINGHCDRLAISLQEDRLILEGSAQVRIQRITTNVSDTNPASFELKGEKLDLRISQLQKEQLLQTGWRPGTSNRDATIRTASLKVQGTQRWSPYGTLRRASFQLGDETVWQLGTGTGSEAVFLVARDGGTLAQYEGRRISVLGTPQRIAGREVVRVTHIALP